MTHVVYEGKDIYLIGTAHVSKKSVEEVERVIEELRPDSVCVELDAQRLRMLEDENSWKKLDIFAVIRQKRVLFLLSTLALSAFQKKMGERDGVRPGSELYAGVLAARRLGAELVLADRDVQATLKRTWANLSFWNKVQITSLLVEAPFRAEEISGEFIESLKDQDTIGEMMKVFADEFPRLKKPFIDERDSFLISAIREAKGKKIVGVVGAAHVAGMKARLHEKVDREELAKLPPPSAVGKIVAWAIPALIVLGFVYGYQKAGASGLTDAMITLGDSSVRRRGALHPSLARPPAERADRFSRGSAHRAPPSHQLGHGDRSPRGLPPQTDRRRLREAPHRHPIGARSIREPRFEGFPRLPRVDLRYGDRDVDRNLPDGRAAREIASRRDLRGRRVGGYPRPPLFAENLVMKPMRLVVGNLNYSSWSMRAWLALTEAEIPFKIFDVKLRESPDYKETILGFSGAGKVPILVDGNLSIHESLAICEMPPRSPPRKGCGRRIERSAREDAPSRARCSRVFPPSEPRSPRISARARAKLRRSAPRSIATSSASNKFSRLPSRPRPASFSSANSA
ncbi:MAG: TraB family protein [Muricomes sp.]